MVIRTERKLSRPPEKCGRFRLMRIDHDRGDRGEAVEARQHRGAAYECWRSPNRRYTRRQLGYAGKRPAVENRVFHDTASGRNDPSLQQAFL